MNNMPPSYVPPGPPPRRGPNCWLVGGLTCLGIVVVAVLAIVLGIASFTHSPAGKKFASSFGSAMQGASMLPQCEENMKSIRDAIMRYHDHTGHYPDSLEQLVPSYLTDSSILHCDLDTNKAPSHISFIYTKPTASSTDSSPLLTMHWIMTMVVGPQSQTTDTQITLTFGGNIKQTQTSSRTMAPT